MSAEISIDAELDRRRALILQLVAEYHDLAFPPARVHPRLVAGAGAPDGCSTRTRCSSLVDAGARLLADGRPLRRAVRARVRRFIGRPPRLLVNSGSSANLLALIGAHLAAASATAGCEPGDEVITVAAGFPTTVNPIVQNGLVPVFVDVDAADVQRRRRDSSRRRSSPKTRAIMLAHTLGNPFDLDAVTDARREARAVAGRGLLRRARRDVQRPQRRHVRRPRARSASTPRTTSRWARAARCSPNAAAAARAGRVVPRLGPRLLVRARQGQHLRQALRPAARQPAVRLRPQVRLQPPRLQPEGDRHAGRDRRRPAGEAARVHRGAPPQLRGATWRRGGRR